MQAPERLQKRSRTDKTIFDNLVDWIRSLPGSFVHDCVEFQARTLRTNVDIQKDTELFRIPAIVAPSAGAKNNKFWHPQNDIYLAIYLLDSYEGLRAYWNSLPEHIDKELPRNWPVEDLDRLLKGSPVLGRVQDQQQGARQDHNATGTNHTFEDFSEALAAVTTRAFQINESTIGMVPLLDLCDHYRGRTKKNLSYRFEDSTCIVRVARDITQSETLRITYGAVSNYKLLADYGFALSDNVEPDGSSNAIVEFVTGSATLELQMGPKSYTYGKLVSLLDAFSDPETGSSCAGRDSLEDVLEQDDSINNQDDEDSIDLYAEPDKRLCVDGNNERQRELAALTKARKALVERANRYVLKKDRIKIYRRSINARERNASLLILSELQTLYFFVTAIDKLAAKLKGDTDTEKVEFVDWDDCARELMEQQTSDLVDAYMKIRHPSIAAQILSGH